MKSAIACDNYKTSTFRRALDDAGFKFEVVGQLTPEITLIEVAHDLADMDKLAKVVWAAENKARATQGGH